ncbi:hypothetical protein [Achromobacter aloeverae]
MLMLVLTPVGATLHAMTHLGHAPPRALAAASFAGGPAASTALPAPVIDSADDEDGHGADAHCHTCDEWQVLDHVLTPTPLLALPSPTFLPRVDPAPRPIQVARGPWILPRAPPRASSARA